MMATFSFPRLLQLIRKQWIENSRFYLLASLALVGLLLIVFSFWVIGSGSHFAEEETLIMFLIGLFLAGTIFASTTFNMLGDKEKGTYWLSFPASHLEKLLCSLFYTVIVFSIVYIAAFLIVKTIAVFFIQSMARENGYTYTEINWAADRGMREAIPYFFQGFIAVQALYLMGSVYFPRYSFIITTIIGSALIFCFVWYMVRIGESFDPHLYNWEFFKVKSYKQLPDGGLENTYQLYSVPEWMKNITMFMLKYCVAPVFWTIAYFRLKEKEI